MGGSHEFQELRAQHEFCECLWAFFRRRDAGFAAIDAQLIPWTVYDALLREGRVNAVRRGLREGMKDALRILDLLLDESPSIAEADVDAFLRGCSSLALSEAKEQLEG